MEAKMRVLTSIELLRLTRIELCDLAARITAALPALPDGSPELLRRPYQPAQYPAGSRAAGLLGVTARPNSSIFVVRLRPGGFQPRGDVLARNLAAMSLSDPTETNAVA
jgi:hypothetical protein